MKFLRFLAGFMVIVIVNSFARLVNSIGQLPHNLFLSLILYVIAGAIGFFILNLICSYLVTGLTKSNSEACHVMKITGIVIMVFQAINIITYIFLGDVELGVCIMNTIYGAVIYWCYKVSVIG